MRGFKENIKMDDPCRECERVEQRNQFLRKHYVPRTELSHLQSDDSAEQTRHKAHLIDKHLIEFAPDAIFIADITSGTILDANQKAADLIGRPLDQIIGLHQWQLHPPDEIKKYKKLFRDYVRAGTVRADDGMYIYRSDEQKIPVEINATVIRMGNKEVVYGIFRDISAQQNLEQKLMQSENEYRELYNHAQIALYRSRIHDGKILECNEAMASLIGYEDKAECLKRCYASAHYADPARRTELIKELKQRGAVQEFEIEYVRRDGTHGWVQISAKIYPQKGYIEGAQVDITVSKVLTEAEKKILGLVLQGKSNKEIANTLSRSVRTVEDHRAHIMQRLNAHNLIELVQKCRFFEMNEKRHTESPKK